jgi:hypothetical protein
MKHLTAKVSLGVLAAAILAAVYIFILGRSGAEQTERLMLVAKYFALFIVFLFATIVLAEMATGRIDLSQLLGEHGSGASMSRFQLLIFTLVIGLSFVIVVSSQNAIPDVSTSVLLLLGISGSTYAVGKGIQASTSKGLEPKGGVPGTQAKS